GDIADRAMELLLARFGEAACIQAVTGVGPMRSPHAYLARIVVNLVNDRARKPIEPPVEDHALFVDDASSVVEDEIALFGEDVAGAFCHLSEPQKVAVVARVYGDADYESIALALG